MPCTWAKNAPSADDSRQQRHADRRRQVASRVRDQDDEHPAQDVGQGRGDGQFPPARTALDDGGGQQLRDHAQHGHGRQHSDLHVARAEFEGVADQEHAAGGGDVDRAEHGLEVREPDGALHGLWGQRRGCGCRCLRVLGRCRRIQHEVPCLVATGSDARSPGCHTRCIRHRAGVVPPRAPAAKRRVPGAASPPRWAGPAASLHPRRTPLDLPVILGRDAVGVDQGLDLLAEAVDVDAEVAEDLAGDALGLRRMPTSRCSVAR